MNHRRVIRRELPIARHLPYTAHVGKHVVTTKAGDYVQVLRMAGASFESADDEDLNSWHERLNVSWRNIASPNIAVWIHVVRRREHAVPLAPANGLFAESLSKRYQNKLAMEKLMVNELYVSIVYRPIAGAGTGALSKIVSSKARHSSIDIGDALDACEKIAQTLQASLARYEPERLGVYENRGRWFSELLEFLGVLINGEREPIPLPRAPLDEVLASGRPLFGTEVIEYRLPTKTIFGAMLGIKEYPSPTSVGMFNSLLSSPFPFVLTQSFTFLTKGSAQGLLLRQYNRMANAGDFAVSQAEELKEALDALTAGEFVMGDHHLTMQVLADPISEAAPEHTSKAIGQLNDRVALARSMLSDTGMAVAREDLALEASYWAQLPGAFAMRPRKAPITSRNLAALASLHNYPSGRAKDNHWGDALSLLITSAHSPYYFNLHASDPKDPDGGSRKDTGHTFICGPTGSGKTVLIGFMLTTLAGRGVTQVVFDKDRGLEILVRALGGSYLPLKSGEPTGFNPLHLDPTPTNIEFLKTWLRMLARGPNALSTREESDLDQALRGTLALERADRRLSRLVEFTDPTRPEGIHGRLARWCYSTAGDYAWVFDNEEDTVTPRLTDALTVGFDVTHFLNHELVRGPINRYLFHLVEQLLDGRPLVCWVDEFSNALADADFESFADNAPKTWRKLNGVICAATQTASSVLKSRIARTVVEQTATKIYFPNPDASADDYVAGFGLSDREFRLLKQDLEPGSRMFLVKQGHSSVVCELDLKGFDAELNIISGRKNTVERLHRLMDDVGVDPAHWLPQLLSEPCRTDRLTIQR